MSDLTQLNKREEWQRSIDKLHKQQVQQSLGELFESDKVNLADVSERNQMSGSASKLSKSRTELNDIRSKYLSSNEKRVENESKYNSVLEAMEKLVPKYREILQKASANDDQPNSLVGEKLESIKSVEHKSDMDLKEPDSIQQKKTKLLIGLLKKTAPKSLNGIKGIIEDSNVSDEQKFNTLLAEFENIITDSKEKVIEKDEIISFNKFKINELTASLSKFKADTEGKGQNPSVDSDYLKQIDALKKERDSLIAQLAATGKNVEAVAAVPTNAEENAPTLVIVENEEGKKVVKSGTAKDLVNRLLDPAAFDLGFLQTFFLSYPLYIDGAELIKILIQNMQEGIRTRFEGGDHNVLRIGNALKYWLDNHFEDFDSNDAILTALDSFLSQNASTKGFNNILPTLKKIIERKLTESSESLDDIPEKPPKSIIPKPNATHVFLSFDPLEFARQLILIEFDLFKAIPPRELLNQYWRVDDENAASNILAYEKWKDRLHDLLLSELTSAKDDKLRLQIFELMIGIVENLEQLNNYSAMYIFSLIFNSQVVEKIKKEKNHLKVMDNLSTLFLPDENYKNLRERLSKCSGPIIPPLEMYQGQLLYLNSRALLQQKEGIIPFYVLQLSSVSILEIRNYQKKPYTFTVVPLIRNYIKKGKSQGVVGEDKVFKGAFQMNKGLFLHESSRSIIDLNVPEIKSLAKSSSEANVLSDARNQDQFYQQASEKMEDFKLKLHAKIEELKAKLSSVEAELAVSRRERDDIKIKSTEKQAELEEKAKKERKDLLHVIKSLKKHMEGRLMLPEGSALKEESKSMKFLTKQGKNILISSTLPFLIKHILDLQTADYFNIAFGLFLHHKLLTQTDELLTLLLMKWRDKNGVSNEDSVKESERIAELIEIWLQNFFTDFQDDSKNLSLITNYINRESLISDSSKVRKIEEIIKGRLSCDQDNKQTMSLTSYPPPLVPVPTFKKEHKGVFVDRSHSKFVLLDFDAEELARQITLMDFAIFKLVEPRELIDENWVRAEKLFNAPNVCKLAQLANHFSNWMVSEIVLVSDLNMRVATMEKIISAAKFLDSMNNFNGIRHVLKALLNSNAINILKKTKNSLSESSKAYLEELKKITSSDFGYSTLRSRISSSSPPIMPLMPLYYSDLSFYESLGSLTHKEQDSENQWINVEKIVGIANTVVSLQQFQKSDYQFQTVPQIQEHILKFPCLLPKEAEDAAVRLESIS